MAFRVTFNESGASVLINAWDVELGLASFEVCRANLLEALIRELGRVDPLELQAAATDCDAKVTALA